MSDVGLYILTSKGLKPHTKRVPNKKKERQLCLRVFYERDETNNPNENSQMESD